MNVVNFISSRFNSHVSMPRSVRVMRTVAAIGIAVAVAALIIAVSIGRGFERVYTKALLDFNSHIVVQGTGEIEHPEGLLTQLLSFKNVVGATPFIYRESLVIAGGNIRGVVVKGIDTKTMRDVNSMQINFFEKNNSIEKMLNSKIGSALPVIVGKALAYEIGISKEKPGMRMMLARKTGKNKYSQDFIELTAVGTFESGMHEYDAEFMIMSLPLVRGIFSAGKNTVSGIELKLNDVTKARTVADEIEKKTGPINHAITWDELNSGLLRAVRLEKFVSALIMGIMVVVAGLNIVATLVLMTLYRMHEIAILKALGLANEKIGKIFIRGGISIGLWGILAGLIIGIAIAYAVGELHLIPLSEEIYFVRALPIDISWPICGILALFCAIVIYMTSWLAAKKLSSVPPAEGLA